eukprot:gene15099-20316_t
MSSVEAIIPQSFGFNAKYPNGLRGYMDKRGHFIKNWQRRYFVLNKCELVCYHDDSCTGMSTLYTIDSTSKVNSTISTNSNSIEDHGRTDLFTIQMKSQSGIDELLYFTASTTSERDAWIIAISESIQYGFHSISQPDVWIHSFQPKYQLNLLYSSHETDIIDDGNIISPQKLIQKPEVTIGYRMSEKSISSDLYFSLVMIDLDFPSHSDTNRRFFLQWGISNIQGSDLTPATEFASYLSPAPAYNTSFHRYFFILFQQASRLESDKLNELLILSSNRESFNIEQWSRMNSLGDPIGINGFYSCWDVYCDMLHFDRGYMPSSPYRSPQQKSLVTSSNDDLILTDSSVEDKIDTKIDTNSDALNFNLDSKSVDTNLSDDYPSSTQPVLSSSSFSTSFYSTLSRDNSNSPAVDHNYAVEENKYNIITNTSTSNNSTVIELTNEDQWTSTIDNTTTNGTNSMQKPPLLPISSHNSSIIDLDSLSIKDQLDDSGKPLAIRRDFSTNSNISIETDISSSSPSKPLVSALKRPNNTRSVSGLSSGSPNRRVSFVLEYDQNNGIKNGEFTYLEQMEIVTPHSPKDYQVKNNSFMGAKKSSGNSLLTLAISNNSGKSTTGVVSSINNGNNSPRRNTINSNNINSPLRNVSNNNNLYMPSNQASLTSRIAAAKLPVELCTVFGIDSPSVFTGDVMQKKYSQDYTFKDTYLWVNPVQRSVHWAKNAADMSTKHNKYILLQPLVADAPLSSSNVNTLKLLSSDTDGTNSKLMQPGTITDASNSPFPSGKFIGVMKDVLLNGLSITITVNSGEFVVVK